jgi:hypothetical protein
LVLNREFRLWFLKLLVNWPVQILDRFLKFPNNSEFPQSRMLLNVYGTMMKTYRLDCVQGVFGAVPDRNFERLLRVSAKVLVNIGESDRYYRAWLGLAFVLAREEYFAQLARLDAEDLVFEIKRQWLSDLSFLSEKQINLDLEGFYEYAICNYLSNLAHKQVTTKTMEVKKQQ